MLKSLYKPFQKWSDGGSIWVISDTHFEDNDCKLMDENWISPEEQIKIIKKYVHKTDTLIHLGDVGNLEYIKQIPGYKVLIMGNHDTGVKKYEEIFDEVYEGPLFISKKVLLSHEKILGPWFNVHGHEHNESVSQHDDHLNLAANVCNYTPINLSQFMKKGGTSKVETIHRQTIDKAKKNPVKREKCSNKNIKDSAKLDATNTYPTFKMSNKELEKLSKNLSKIPLLCDILNQHNSDELVISSSARIKKILHTFEFQPELFCTNNNSWQLEWEGKGKYLEFEIDLNNNVKIFAEWVVNDKLEEIENNKKLSLENPKYLQKLQEIVKEYKDNNWQNIKKLING